jgi:hypothetical protein
MARLPDFQDFGQRPGLPAGGGVTRLDVQRDPTGDLMAGAGRELQDAAQIIDRTNEQQDRIAADAALNALNEQSATLQFDPKDGFRNAKGGAVVGQPFVDTYIEHLQTRAKGIADGLQNDRQRALFTQRSPVVALRYRQDLLNHQAQQTEFFNDQTANNTLELALRSMAQAPTDELGFQTSMVQIEATVDETVKRKGLPPEAAAALKGKYTDAAYSTRILSLLEGVPGAVQADPYTAERMFRQVRDRLGPQAALSLGKQVLQGVKDVQQRDGARAEVYGGGAMDARAVYPAVQGVVPLAGVVMELESRGARFDKDGNLLTSPKGAQGEMQVMPATTRDPGFGVTPARDNSPEEIARVGRDYVGAMTARYQEPALVLAAYNAGPATVDKWITKHGDPRAGEITVDEWIAKIPFSETQKYVANGMRKVVAATGGDPAAVSGPTVNQLKAEALPALLQRARQHAESMYPGDPRFVDGYVARTLGYANEVLNQQRARQDAANDTLTRALVGSKGDGSDAVKSIDQLMSDPTLKAAFETATPQAQLAMQARLAKGDKKFDAESFQIYYGLLGSAGQDPAAFAQMDLGPYYGLIPDEKLVELARYQKSINANDAKQQARDLNWQRTKANVEDMLKPLRLGTTAKAGSSQAKTTEQFYGRLNEAVQDHFTSTGKWPDTQTTRKFAAGLLAEGKEAGGMFWDSSRRAFEVDDSGKFYVPLPAARTPERTEITQAYQRVFGKLPSEPELQRFWTQYRLSGAKK